jgi:hypothetical protein
MPSDDIKKKIITATAHFRGISAERPCFGRYLVHALRPIDMDCFGLTPRCYFMLIRWDILPCLFKLPFMSRSLSSAVPHTYVGTAAPHLLYLVYRSSATARDPRPLSMIFLSFLLIYFCLTVPYDTPPVTCDARLTQLQYE